MRINWRIIGLEIIKLAYLLSSIFLGIISLIIVTKILELLVFGVISFYQPESELLDRGFFLEIFRLFLTAIAILCFNQMSNLMLKILSLNNSVSNYQISGIKTPSKCYQCQWFHGRTYGGNYLVCGIHPYGKEDCLDFDHK
jgi:hypothetical protein